MGKKKKTEISYSSRAPIRHAYDSVLTRLARLAAFSSCGLLNEWGEVDQRLEDLAVDDLIALAIHLRRLLELTSHTREATKVAILAIFIGETKHVPVTRIVNGIIHHSSLSIARRKSDTMPLPDRKTSEGWLEWHTAFKIGVKPIAHLSSDKIDFLAFNIEMLVMAIAKHILAPIIEYCDENELYLEDMDVD